MQSIAPTEKHFQISPKWKRLVNYLIDQLVIVGVVLLVGVEIYGMELNEFDRDISLRAQLLYKDQ